MFVWSAAVVRNDGLPLGSFCKHTWHITSLTQVKRVFDTSEVNAYSLLQWRPEVSFSKHRGRVCHWTFSGPLRCLWSSLRAL